MSLDHNVDDSRPWLPGPPPPRRKIGVSDIVAAYRADGHEDLMIPIHKVFSDNVSLLRHSEAQILQKLSITSEGETTLLFHGCGTAICSEVLGSFSKMGPSMRFARPRSYFSKTPAVYWTSSIRFAIAWCVFTKTGKWPSSNQQPDPSESIIVVARANLKALEESKASCMIRGPTTIEEEEELVQWCSANMSNNSQTAKPPPGFTNLDWGLIGSRVPRSTIDGLAYASPSHQSIFTAGEAEGIWLYAATRDDVCRGLARASAKVYIPSVN